MIGTTALGAALALKTVIEELGGTVVVFGTPGEENLCTKTTLSEQGINALDAAVQCYQLIRTEKKKYHDVNVHGIINAGGEKASIIPDYSSLKYLSRVWDMETLAILHDMVEQCAKKAAEETGCTFRVTNNELTNRSMVTNQRISEVFNRNLLEFGEPEILYQDVAGSTDMADVSWRIPAIHPWVGLNCPGTELHSAGFAEKTLTADADLFLERCSKVLACTTAEILTDGQLLARIKEEFQRNVGK